MNPDARRKYDLFFKVLAGAFGVGFVVAVILCWVWRYHPAAFTEQVRLAAIAICPPFLLAGILEATSDAPLAVIITVPSIVFANGFLYAGLASFVYFLGTVFFSRRRA
jgi:hypothetical protein